MTKTAKTTKSFLATFDTPAEAAAAVDSLVEAGFDRDAITVMSAEPINLGEHEEAQHHNPMGWIALAGGIVGAGAAILLTIGTSRNMGLVVGGMPIVSPWAFGIIVFEVTALGAILALFLKTIVDARLARPRALVDYDPSVSDGKIAVAVACVDDEAHKKASQAVIIKPKEGLKRSSAV